MSQTCPYCREAIPESDYKECPACNTPHHHDCWEENGGCTVFGCEHAPVDDPKIAVSSQDLSGPAGSATYFVAHNGQQMGPYTLESLRQDFTRGYYTRDDLGWTTGLIDWIPLPQLLDSPRSPAPYSYPGAVAAEIDDPCAGRPHFGRGVYFLSIFAGSLLMGAFAGSHDTRIIGQFIFLCILIPVSVYRAMDLGMSGWNALWLFVPVANLLIFFRLLLGPRGYAITKKADTALRVMTWIFLAFLALLLLGIFLNSMDSR